MEGAEGAKPRQGTPQGIQQHTEWEEFARPYKAVDRVSPIFSKMHFLPVPHGFMLKAAFRAHQVIQAV